MEYEGDLYVVSWTHQTDEQVGQRSDVALSVTIGAWELEGFLVPLLKQSSVRDVKIELKRVEVEPSWYMQNKPTNRAS